MEGEEGGIGGVVEKEDVRGLVLSIRVTGLQGFVCSE